MKDTDFESVADVFSGAWERIDKAIQTAASHGLGVLVDLHAAAGAQNADAHSGISTGKPELFNKKANLRSTSLALKFLTSYCAPLQHVVGLQLLNEPANNNSLQGWYESTLKEVRAIAGPDFPVYVHDAWDTAHYARWVGSRKDFVVVDHHLYRAFTPEDKAIPGAAHAQKLHGEFKGPFSGQCGDAQGNLVVAEWSGGLDDWGKGMDDPERDRNKREFVRAQLALFEECTAGWWFWTYKKGNGWDAGWSARDATQAEVLPGWVGGRQFRGPPPPEAKQQAQDQGHGEHKNYWANNGGSPDPEMYAPGFSQGWDDALIFLGDSRGVSEMGFVNQWASKRREEFERSHPLGKAAWEWEHGFRQGVQACARTCLA